MSNPKISIIMPSLNVKKFIEECIESVINQTLKDIEIICIDAGSSDGTLEVLKKYSKKDSRINLIQTDKKSYGYQVNLGIDKANGEYIGIVETDDFIDKKMYETLYDLTDNGSTDVSKVNFYHYYDSDPDDISYRVDVLKEDLPKGKFTIYEHPNIIKGHPSIWAAIYKKSFLKENNIRFMEVPGGGWVDNPFLFETFICAKSITYSEKPFYYYREQNPDSSTNSLSDLTLPLRRVLDIFEVLDKYSCYYRNVLSAFYIRVFWHVYDLSRNYDLGDQKDEVLSYFSQVLKRLDETIVLTDFKKGNQRRYYKYLNDDSNFKNTITSTNWIIENALDSGESEENKYNLFNTKVDAISMRYSYIEDVYKKDAYDAMKEDFYSIWNHECYDDFISNISLKNSEFFKMVVESPSFEAFDLSYGNLKLTKNNKKLNRDIKKIKADIRDAKKIKKDILNSRSWKVTKPLRSIRKHNRKG